MNNLKHQRLIVFIFFMIIVRFVSAQNTDRLPQEPFKALSIESYLSIIPDELANNVGLKKLHLENLLNLTVMTNLSQDWQVGLQYNHIWTRFDKMPVDKFYSLGVLGRYNYVLVGNIKVYGEAGLSLGNYCTCLNDVKVLDELPFKKENMLYFYGGLGFLGRVYKGLWFRAGISGYRWLNKSKNIYYTNMNIPTIGFVFNITKQ